MMERKRINAEIFKLCQRKFNVQLVDNCPTNLRVKLIGPNDSPYANAKFSVSIMINDDYPFKSPSIGFLTRIYHPNIDERSGSVCLDVLNQVWSPMYDLTNVMEIFLPQLLLYPNPHDPLNADAADKYLNDRELFNETVEYYVKNYCIEDVVEESSEEDVIDSDELGF